MVDGYASGLAKTALIDPKFKFNPFWARRERKRQNEDAPPPLLAATSGCRPAKRDSHLSLGTVDHRCGSERPRYFQHPPVL
jgi:hypothetical protein